MAKWNDRAGTGVPYWHVNIGCATLAFLVFRRTDKVVLLSEVNHGNQQTRAIFGAYWQS